jgi:hypothetical protein
VKARVYAWFLDGEDEVESEFTRYLETTGPTGEAIMLAIVQDLLRQQRPTA